MPQAPSWTHHRARLANLSRTRPADDPEVLDARRDFTAARLEDYVQKTLAAAPPLTDEQGERIARLLRPGARATTVGGGRR